MLTARPPPQSGWLDEWGRLKGGRPFYPTRGSYKIYPLLDKTKERFTYSPSVPHF